MNAMNRREMLKLGSAGSLAALGSVMPAMSEVAVAEIRHKPVPKWDVFELTLQGPATGNPFTEVELAATFALGLRTVQASGFYDGAGSYKIRFMPDTEGSWTYSTHSGAAALHGKTGSFDCVAALPGVHGPVGVRNMHHFAYADGSAYFPFGTTCYAWIHQSDELQRQTLETLRTAPFNKIRMCVFPKSYEYNHNEPALYPFERNAAGESDFTRPNPAFFAHVEQRIADLRELGIEADLILFHPYDRWGYSTMPEEADDRYLRYVLARMSAYRNIWWSMANEFDLMKAKSVQDFDRLFHIVEQYDPVGHLRSIHFSVVMYDYSHPWVTHVCLQSAAFDKAPEWLKVWKKPGVFDEVMYEGNLNKRWGNISGEEMARRFWLGVIAGCYVTHGETLLDPNGPLDENSTPVLWWAHGGKLKGTSPARIAFLRKLVEETAAAAGRQAKRTGLEAQSPSYYLNASSVDGTGKKIEEILYYMDFHQPIYYEFPLPEGSFTAELIDPWEMTVKALPGRVSGKAKIKLAGRPYQAVRFRRAD
jgi:Domain of unknown function (DUF5060)/Protein of unknown function (DUF4038)/Domain of unknown function (DUF5605)